MTHHTVSHESVTPRVHSLSDIFTRLLWIPSLLAQWAPWCELATSRPALDSCCSSNVSHLSLLNRSFRKHLKCSSGLLSQASIQIDAQPTDFTSLFAQWKDVFTSLLAYPLLCLINIKSCIVPQHIFGPSIYQSWISSSPAGSWNCSCTENAANKDQASVPSSYQRDTEQAACRAEQECQPNQQCHTTDPCAPPSLAITSLVALTLLVLSNSSSSSYLNYPCWYNLKQWLRREVSGPKYSVPNSKVKEVHEHVCAGVLSISLSRYSTIV